MERMEDEAQTHAGSGMDGGAMDADTMAGGAPLSDEEVRQRAYELYQARGGSGGSDVDDWLAAEREVRARAAASGRGDARSREAGTSSGDRAPMGDMSPGDAGDADAGSRGESRGEGSESGGAARAARGSRARGEKPGRRGRAD